ncbi:MAG: hypothetical protein A3J38_02710 [Gammaproteobacteria bacterium RIFCSPHIGHO2_12_FULL_45_9]|nr:MAG: hypothetical protein A3J38_02710 [Gammaproteobacteria bacterium RIFCSPHIGHO2_12_FULL_45_9]
MQQRYRPRQGHKRLDVMRLLDHWMPEEALEQMFLREKDYYRDDPEYVGKYQIALCRRDRIADVLRSLVRILNRHPEIVELDLGGSSISTEEACLLSRLQYVRRLNLRSSAVADMFHPQFKALLAMEAYRPWLSPCATALFLGKNSQERMRFLEQLQVEHPEIQKQLSSTALIEVVGAQRIEQETVAEVLRLIRDEEGKCPSIAPLLGDFTYLNPATVDALLGDDLKALPVGHFDKINLGYTVIGDSTCRYLLKLHDEQDPRAPTFVQLFDTSISPDVYEQIRAVFEDPDDPLFQPPRVSKQSVFTQASQSVEPTAPKSHACVRGCMIS